MHDSRLAQTLDGWVPARSWQNLDDWTGDGTVVPGWGGEERMDRTGLTPAPEHGPIVPSAPGHLWAIGVISLLWNAFGCYDYAMTQVRDPATMAAMTPETIAYLDAMPAWLTAFWAIGVWGSLAGSLLLLGRSRHAVIAFAASLLGLAVSQLYQMATDRPQEMSGTAMAIFMAIIWGALALFLTYAVCMKRAGVLR